MIVTSFSPLRIADELWVDGGRIAPRGVGRRIDADAPLVIPGLVCAHTHLYSALARGMPYHLESPTNFVEILQRIWWRLDRALDPEAVSASALVGGMEALLSGTTTLVDHHASPNAVDGSLDAIADALALLGNRSVLCYETSDRDGEQIAAAGLAENRRFVEQVRRERPPLVRAMVGAHASFTLSDETLAGCVDAAHDLSAGLHIHVAEDRADEEDALLRAGMRVVDRLERFGALDDRALLAHGVHLDHHELELVAAAGSRVVHNARSNMNNSIGRAAVEALGARVALGTDGIGSDMFEESRAAYFRLREDDVLAGGGWPLERLAESARLAGELYDEPLLGTLAESRARGSRSSRLPRARAARRVDVPGTLGVRALVPPRARRDGRRRVGGARPAPHARRPRRARSSSGGRGAPSLAAPRGDAASSVQPEGSSRMDRVALYLQDKHPIREGMEYVQLAERAGFEAVWQAESRLVREATVPLAAYAAVTERIGVGSGVVNTWTRNVGLLAATFSTLDDLAPGRVRLGIGAWWDPLAAKVGIHRRANLRCMRETVEATRRLLAMERVTYHGEFVNLDDVEIDIVHGDRSPKHVPIYIGATAMKMMELAGEIADGVLLNYLVGPAYNREAMQHLEAGAARAGRTLADVDRPQLVVCSLDRDRSLALDRARELVTQYLGQQPHIMKASGVDESLLEEIGSVLTWPATAEQIERAMSLVPDDVVQLITASGTPEDCRAKVQEYIDSGCTCPILYPLGDDVAAMIDTFAAVAV